MAQRVRNDLIQFRNLSFAIHHHIDDCPPQTVVREILKNAEEAAACLTPAGRIEWFVENVSGVRKLGLFNEGPGMSDEELSRYMDLASTGKRLGTDANYGQGAKVSGLKVSPAGLIYRSCKAGRVCEIVLQAQDQPNMDFPVYVKKRRQVGDGDGFEWQTVLDVTERYASRQDRRLDREWTEVLMIGKTAGHDTVAELIPGMKMKSWLPRLINRRFYRFAPGVSIAESNATTGAREARTARGMEYHVLKFSERHEDVSASHPKYGPVVFRYIKLIGDCGDQAKTSRSREGTLDAYGLGRGDHVGIVWRNEVYDYRPGWSQISGAFGVTFGTANLAIDIVFPNDAPVKNNTYRDAILEKGGECQQVRVEEFAELIRQHRPAWLLEYLDQEDRKNQSNDDVMDVLREYLRELKTEGGPRDEVEGEGTLEGDSRQSGEGGRSGDGDDGGRTPNPSSDAHRPAVGRRTVSKTRGIPRVDFTTDFATLQEMSGRAALYRKEENRVLLNPQHFNYLGNIEQLNREVGPDAERQALAKQYFDREYRLGAGRFVVQAWFNRCRPEFSDDDFAEALSIGSLTTHLVSPDALKNARHRLRSKLNSAKVASLSEGGDE